MQKVVVAITGASGSIYAKRLLTKLCALKSQVAEVAVVMSSNAGLVWQTELGDESFKEFPVSYFQNNDFFAPFASGSSTFGTLMIVPCSMGTVGRIAAGISNDLITRAADVMLKERRKLILVPRETPYNLVQVRNMETVTLAGGIICPASPSFYSRPKTFEQLADTVVDRVIHLAGLEAGGYKWGEQSNERNEEL